MADDRIPVVVLTGFLGSGKTTLLSRALRNPALGRTAVVVNEFGEVGLDHDLVERADEQLVQLTTGCLCCAVRGDIAETLLDLHRRRQAGDVPPFERVVVETSGLADPAPILHALLADPGVLAAFRVGGVVTVVDAVHGARTLERHGEARRQVAVADRLLWSKQDVQAVAPALAAAVAGLNAAAPRGGTETDDWAWTEAGPAGAPDTLPREADHTEGVGTCLVLRERPVPGAALALWLQALAAHAGPRLLRLKGLVDVAEAPGTPAVVHGVQHVFAPPEWRPRWPGPDRTTRVVVIGQGLPVHWPGRLLEAIEAEVRDEAARHGACSLSHAHSTR